MQLEQSRLIIEGKARAFDKVAWAGKAEPQGTRNGKDLKTCINECITFVFIFCGHIYSSLDLCLHLTRLVLIASPSYLSVDRKIACSNYLL